MIDFSKRVEKKRVVDVSDPIKLFESLDRHASHTTLRPVQEKALEELRARRNDRNVILKMSTGAGKTTVALLYLKSHMAEKKHPGVYLCPNVQLVNQVIEEAQKLGIEAVQYPAEEPHPSAKGMSGQAVIVCTYKKLFNAKTTFDRNDVLLRPCAIVLDDAHAGVEEIRNAFTLQLAKSDLHEGLLKLLDSSCEKYAHGTWESIKNRDPLAFIEVPYWLWKPILSDVQKLLSPHSSDKSLCFVWPYLRNHLRWCRCVVSGAGIEIVPDVIPISLVNAYHEAKHRLFMSATLADDSTLVRELDCDSSAAKAPIIQREDSGLGERMVLAPCLVDKKLSREWVMDMCKEHSKKFNVVALCFNEESSCEWKKFGATVALKDDVIPLVNDLRARKITFAAFAQRYDGIDLPDNACRILVIDGMPHGQGITDKYDSEKIKVAGGTRNRLIYRIEQGMGRAVRSHADFAVIILAGPELANFIAKREVLELMNPDTKAQLELAQELAQIAMEDINTKPADAISDMLKKCLNRDIGWKQFYHERVRSVTQKPAPDARDRHVDLASAEQQAAQAAAAQNPEKAAVLLEQAISKLTSEEKEKGWFLQKVANYRYEINPGKALELQKAAYEKNRSCFCSPVGIVNRPIDPVRFESSALVLNWYNTFENANGAIAELQTLRSQLSYEVKPKLLKKQFTNSRLQWVLRV